MELCFPASLRSRFFPPPTGRVRYALKTPFRNGTIHVIFKPLDFTGFTGFTAYATGQSSFR